MTVLHTPPSQYGQAQSRWTLATLRASCPWLQLGTDGGLCQLLARLTIRRKRARTYLHSPDPDYAAKVAYLDQCRQQLSAAPERRVLVYLDEVAFERQPTLAPAYEAQGTRCPLAHLSYRSNTRCRGLGALDAQTGQVHYLQPHQVSAAVLARFYAQLAASYPQAEVIYVVQDNWPVHVHPQAIMALQAQHSPFWPRVPQSWPLQDTRAAAQGQLPIQLVFLPTYAPWLNPIEKLWRWLRQQVLHLHRWSDAWEALKQQVLDFMAQFALGSLALLRYVGLLPY